MKRILTVLVALCLAMLPLGARAGFCYGNVYYLAVDGAGNVSVVMSWRPAFGYLQFCNMSADWKGVSPLICATWYSLLKTAQQSKLVTYWQYSDVAVTSTNGPGCTAMPTEGDSPAPLKILISPP